MGKLLTTSSLLLMTDSPEDLLKPSEMITLITKEVPKFLRTKTPPEKTSRPPSSVDSWSDSMSSFSISKLPWMTLSKLRSEPVETPSLSSKNLRKRPTSSRSNSTDTPLMPPNLRTISSSPKTWKPEPSKPGTTPSPLLSKPRLSSSNTENGTCPKSIDSETTSKLLMRLLRSSSKNSKVLLMTIDSPKVCSETLTLTPVSTLVKPTGKV